jgi:hypothetical protein
MVTGNVAEIHSDKARRHNVQQEVAVTITPRTIALIVIAVGAVLMAVGAIAVATEVTVIASGDTVGCGTAASPNKWAASSCDSALETRQLWAWTLVGLGAIVALGQLILFPSSRRNPGVASAT